MHHEFMTSCTPYGIRQRKTSDIDTKRLFLLREGGRENTSSFSSILGIGNNSSILGTGNNSSILGIGNMVDKLPLRK
jgi:hypothetical protein